MYPTLNTHTTFRENIFVFLCSMWMSVKIRARTVMYLYIYREREIDQKSLILSSGRSTPSAPSHTYIYIDRLVIHIFFTFRQIAPYVGIVGIRNIYCTNLFCLYLSWRVRSLCTPWYLGRLLYSCMNDSCLVATWKVLTPTIIVILFGIPTFDLFQSGEGAEFCYPCTMSTAFSWSWLA